MSDEMKGKKIAIIAADGVEPVVEELAEGEPKVASEGATCGQAA